MPLGSRPACPSDRTESGSSPAKFPASPPSPPPPLCPAGSEHLLPLQPHEVAGLWLQPLKVAFVSQPPQSLRLIQQRQAEPYPAWQTDRCPDRKSTRLNSSHVAISYAV